MRSSLGFLTAFLAAAALAGGCGPGSSGGGAASQDGGGSDGGGSDVGAPGGGAGLSWKADGVMHTALAAGASLVKSAANDYIQIAGSDAGGAIFLGVSTAPPLQPGTYACNDETGGRIVRVTYTVDNTTSLVPTCTIVLTTLGAASGEHTTGTFSGSLSLASGATTALTEGKFDLELTVNSI